MTFESVYRDINSYITKNDIFEEEIYHNDVVKAINDGIRKLRREYISNGLGLKFSATETVDTLSEDSSYSFLNSGTLNNKIEDSVEINDAIINVVGYEVSAQLLDEAHTFSKGDLALRGNEIYKATEDISNTNTYNDIFSAATVRNFYKGNGLSYKVGDIVYDIEGDSYYEVNTAFDNDTSTAPGSLTELDLLYWKKVRDSYVHVSKYPFYAISYLSAFDEYNQTQGIVVNQDTIYCTKGLEKVILTYIPEWTDVTDLDTTVNIPDFMVSDLKNLVINKLLSKRVARKQEREGINE